MAKEYSREIADAINAFLTDDDWKYYFIEDRGHFKFTLTIGSKMKTISYTVMVHEDSYTVYAISPIGADKDEPESITRLAEFTCRANYGLRNGNFELDFRDGELRYKVFVDCEDRLPSREIIANSIRCPGAMFRRYSKAILATCLTEDDVAKAVEQCENDIGGDTGAQLEALLAALRDEAPEGDAEAASQLDELKSLLESLRSGSEDDDDDSEEGDED